MKKTKALLRSLEVARDRELRAWRSVQQLEADLARQSQKLEQLRGYGSEYRAALCPQAGTVLPIHAVMRTSAFLSHLDKVIFKQTEQIEQLKEAYEKEKQCWQEQRRNHAALDKYVSRLKRQTVQRELRSEIRAMDDYPRSRNGFENDG